MIETAILGGFSALEESLLAGTILAEAGSLQFELLIPTLMLGAGLFIFRGIKNKHDKEQREREQRESAQRLEEQRIQRERQAEEEQRLADEQARILEEQRVENERKENQAKQNQINIDSGLTEEALEEQKLEDEREQRIAEMRTPDEDIYLYPPEVQEEIRRIEEEAKRNNNPMPMPDGGGGGPNGDGGNGGGGGNGPDGGPDNNPDDIDFELPHVPDARDKNQNPFKSMIDMAVQKIYEEYNHIRNQEEDEAVAKEKNKDQVLTPEQEQWEREHQEMRELTKQQLEMQKQLVDVLQALGIGEITSEESLVELGKIEEDIKKMTDQQAQQNAQVKTSQIYSGSLVSF